VNLTGFHEAGSNAVVQWKDGWMHGWMGLYQGSHHLQYLPRLQDKESHEDSSSRFRHAEFETRCIEDEEEERTDRK
jgi:hypothetical protein